MTAPERQLPARPFAAEHALLCWTRDDKEGSDAAGGVAQRGERSNLRANRSSPRVGRPASLVDCRRVSDIVIGACSGTTDVVTHSYDYGGRLGRILAVPSLALQSDRQPPPRRQIATPGSPQTTLHTTASRTRTSGASL